MTTRAGGTSEATGQGSHDRVTLSDRQRAEEILVILGRLGRAMHDAIATRVDTDLVGNADVFVICSLDLRGPLRPSDIVDGMGMTSGGVTKLIDRLEQRGYIRREYGAFASDRRATRLVLTEEGAQLARDYADVVLAEMDTVADAIRSLRDLSDPADANT
jgi:DNA-binding MarR family transcriptional regulator